MDDLSIMMFNHGIPPNPPHSEFFLPTFLYQPIASQSAIGMWHLTGYKLCINRLNPFIYINDKNE